MIDQLDQILTNAEKCMVLANRTVEKNNHRIENLQKSIESFYLENNRLNSSLRNAINQIAVLNKMKRTSVLQDTTNIRDQRLEVVGKVEKLFKQFHCSLVEAKNEEASAVKKLKELENEKQMLLEALQNCQEETQRSKDKLYELMPFKLLTNLNFVYKKGELIGYVSGKTPGNVDKFKYEIEDIDQILQNLWEMIDRVASNEK